MYKIISVVLMTAILTACSTGYHKKDFFGHGFDEIKTSENSYEISYNSNAATEKFENKKHALRRAAELTKENGYKYFVVTEKQDISTKYKSKEPTKITTNTSKGTSGSFNTYGVNANENSVATTSISGGETRTHVEPGILISVKMSNIKVDNAYEADAFLSNYSKDK